jgi:enoyl-CoA hydratase/carnithine racemase
MADDLGSPALRLERDGPLAWLTIDRPAARNAFTPAMYFGIKRAVRLVNSDPELAALVVTGTGDVFSAGGDLGGRSEPGEELPDHVGLDVLPFLEIRDSTAPVIAAVNGLAHGGGFLIAMLADVAVVSERATFRAPELLRGIPDAFFAATLPAHVGVAVARDLLLSGRTVDAHEALRLGLVARVVPHEELRQRAGEAAREVLRTAPEARMHVKRMLNERYGRVDFDTMRWALQHGAEPREGMRAFLERRPPSWVPDDLA